MRQRQLRVAAALLLTALSACLAACGGRPTPQDFDYSPFREAPGAIALCFDLRVDERPTAGLILTLNQTEKIEPHTLALPFGSSAVSMNREIFSTWGSYEATTLVSFRTSPETRGKHWVGIVPVWGGAPDKWNDDPRDLSRSSLFLLRYGLTRHFIYKYPDKDPSRKRWLDDVKNVADVSVDSIGVFLPPNVEGKPIKQTGRAYLPEPLTKDGGLMFFAATNAAEADALYIKYEIPPNKNQQFVIEQIIALLVAVLPLIAQFVVLRFLKPEHRTSAERIILVVLILQLGVVIWLLTIVFTSWQEAIGKALSSLVIAIITSSISGYLLWKDKKDDPKR